MQNLLDSTLSLRIKNLPFTTRVVNCCYRAGICILGQLVRKTERELRKWRNFGQKSLAETEALLASKDLHLGLDSPIGQLEREAMLNSPLIILMAWTEDWNTAVELHYTFDKLSSDIPTVESFAGMPEDEALRILRRNREKWNFREPAQNYFYRLHRALEKMQTAIRPRR